MSESAGATDLDTVLAMERRVWDALVTGDAALDSQLIAPDFLGVYPDGFSGRDDHTGTLHAGPTVASYELSDERLIVIDPDNALLVYRAGYVRVGPKAVPEAMYVSSLWTRRTGGTWVNIFSQDTPEDLGHRVV